MPINDQERMQLKLRRILLLIDTLAPIRQWLPLKAVHAKLTAREGCDYCLRTVRRDLSLLKAMGLVECRAGAPPQGNRLFQIELWRLNLTKSVPLQRAAIVLDSADGDLASRCQNNNSRGNMANGKY